MFNGISWYHGRRPTKELYQVIKAMLKIGINDHFWDEVLEIETFKEMYWFYFQQISRFLTVPVPGPGVYQAYREPLLPFPLLSLP